MTAPIIVLLILGILALIASIRVQITIEYNDSLRMYVRIMQWIRINITPKEEKQIKLSAYSPRALTKREKKRLEKERKKQEKKLLKKQQKQKKKAEKKQNPSQEQGGRTLSQNISLIADVVKVLFSRFFRHLRIDLSRIHICVATGDAAKTAMVYGAVCQSVAYLLEIMERIRTIHPPDLSDVSVTPDWLGEKTTVDIKLSFSLRVWHVFDMLGRVIGRFVTHLFREARSGRLPHTPPRTAHKSTSSGARRP